MSSQTAVRGRKILLLDEAHSNNVDTELVSVVVCTAVSSIELFKQAGGEVCHG